MTAPVAISAARVAATGTHASITDPDAWLARKGKESKLSYLANTLMENRNELIVGVDMSHVSGRGEREGALVDARGLREGSTLGADKGNDTQEFVAELKARGFKVAIARNTGGAARWTVARRPASTLQSASSRESVSSRLGLGEDGRAPAQAAADNAAEGPGVGELHLRRLQSDPHWRYWGVVVSVAELRSNPSVHRQYWCRCRLS